MNKLLAASISVSALQNWITRCVKWAQPVEEHIKTALQQVGVLYQDKTRARSPWMPSVLLPIFMVPVCMTVGPVIRATAVSMHCTSSARVDLSL
jgi:hypothetical protein